MHSQRFLGHTMHQLTYGQQKSAAQCCSRSLLDLTVVYSARVTLLSSYCGSFSLITLSTAQLRGNMDHRDHRNAQRAYDTSSASTMEHQHITSPDLPLLNRQQIYAPSAQAGLLHVDMANATATTPATASHWAAQTIRSEPVQIPYSTLSDSARYATTDSRDAANLCVPTGERERDLSTRLYLVSCHRRLPLSWRHALHIAIFGERDDDEWTTPFGLLVCESHGG